MKKKHLLPLTLSLAVMGQAYGASNSQNCEPAPPATCYADDCTHCYCLGPDNYGVNAPTCPKTCDGDLTITVAGVYWNAHQDGMEYAINNHVVVANASPDAIQELNNIIDAKFENPKFDWDFGFKLGLGYCSPCDGWDISVLWTWYQGKANSHIEANLDDNSTLITLWSAYAPQQGLVTYATDIETHWKLEMNLVDLELGRSYWVSKYLSMRPFVGIRIAYLDQSYDIQHKGGSWTANPDLLPEPNFNNQVDLDSKFKGAGLRSGLNTLWNLGCGWGIYGNFAIDIVYGRFDIDHDETNRQATSPHAKTKIADTKESFRASRAMTDLALGLQWQTMFCECKYGFSIALGYEQHLFFDQNQWWRVVRVGDAYDQPAPNNTGENVFHQRRGDLDTQGWTLTAKFDF